MGLVELIDDPDKNGVFKITDKDTQKFKIMSVSPGSGTAVQIFDLADLTLVNS